MGRLHWTNVAAGVAAALVAVGSVLEWMALDSGGVTFAEGGIAGSATGIETGLYGWAGLLLGTISMVGAFLWVFKPLRRLSAPVVLLGGAAALGLAIFVFISLESRFVDYAVKEAASTELPPPRIRALFRALFEEGSIVVRPAMGLILLAVGGATALVAGIAGLGRGRPSRPDPRRAGAQRVPSPPPQKARNKFGF
jgi:hypothetical protein